MVRDSLSRILAHNLDNQHWTQAKLSVAAGGLGLRGAFEHASAAYISSAMSCEHLVAQILELDNLEINLSQALTHLSKELDMDGLSREGVLGETQKMLSTKIDSHKKSVFLSSLEKDRDKARMGALGLSHSGDWLYVIPSPSLGLNLRPQEFRLACLYRLGAQVFGGDGPCVACRAHSDKFGDHAISCGWEGERIARHNSLKRCTLPYICLCISWSS